MAITTPAPPIGCYGHRMSTTQNFIGWENKPTANAPYDSLRLEYSINGGASWVVIADMSGSSIYFIHIASALAAYLYRVRATNSAGTSAYSTSSTATITKPAPPTIGSVVRVSDTQHTVSWTRNATTAAPYTTMNVQRYDNAGSTWVTIRAGLAGTATSYSDTTTVANRRYNYRVYASNTAGTGGSGETGSIDTTPSAPSSLHATRAVSDIALTWNDNSKVEAGFEIYESEDGGAYALLHTTFANATGYTHTSPASAKTHTYKVRAKATTGGTLYSVYSAVSETIQLPTAPNVPTGLTGGTFDGTEEITLGWTHNPVDSTEQTYYEMQYRLVGAGSWSTTGAIESGVSSHTFAAATLSNGEDYEWQVKTKGQYVDYSGYSATQTIKTSARPTAALVEPPSEGTTITEPSITVEWAYYDAEGTAQTKYRVVLYDEVGTLVLKTHNGTGSASTRLVEYVLEDGVNYQVGVTVWDSDGMESAETIFGIVVEYAEPMAPTVAVEYDIETGSANIEVTNPEPTGGEPAVIYNDVYRVINGVAELLVGGVDPNGTCTDYIPLTNGTNGYYAVAYSALPSATTSSVEEIDAYGVGGYIYLNGGSAFGTVAVLRFDPSVKEDKSRETSLEGFAGRTSPVLYEGEAVTQELALSCTFLSLDALAELDTLIAETGLKMYRDAAGRRVLCATPGGYSINHSSDDLIAVSLKVMRVEA